MNVIKYEPNVFPFEVHSHCDLGEQSSEKLKHSLAVPREAQGKETCCKS